MTGDQIKRLRGYLGATQEQFARLVHTTAGTVSRWESDYAMAEPDRWQREILACMWNTATEYPGRASVAAGYIQVGAWVQALRVLLSHGSVT